MKILKNLLNNLWNNPKRNSVPYLLVIGFFVFLTVNYETLRKSNFGNRLSLNPPTAGLRAHTYDFQNLFSSRYFDTPQEQSPFKPFENIKLEAKAAYVFDISKNQPIFELNADSQLPLASLTKIMTAFVAKEKLPSYLLVTITKEAVLQEGDEGFVVGEQWPVSDLIDAMFISSSNDAALSLASEFEKDFGQDFISLMNQKAGELNLAQTYFLNATGLDLSKNISGGYGSAKDVAKLFLYIMKNAPSLIEVTRFNSLTLHSREFKNTNRVVNDLPGFIVGKTGFSDLAGGNLAIMTDKGYSQPFIIVVLGSTYDGRFTDVKTLYNLIP